MITKVTGDILLTDARAIAHGVAPHDHFNQGLALSLKQLHPAMVKDFRHYCFQFNPKAGSAWIWASPERVIFNLLTQEPAKDKNANPGKATHANINHALKDLQKQVIENNIHSLALPKLATGVGGCEWSEVEPLIEKHLGDLNIPVFIYETYKKGVKADEKLKSEMI